MAFATGDAYDANSSGVGPYLLEDKSRDANDSFIKSYDSANRWRAQKELEKKQKAALLDAKLADLDFKTEGIRPGSAPFFQVAKERMVNHLTESFTRGVDPTDPRFIKEYQEAQQIKKQYQVLVDADVGVNTILNETLEKVRANPDKYDIAEVTDWYRNVYNAPVMKPTTPELTRDYRVSDEPINPNDKPAADGKYYQQRFVDTKSGQESWRPITDRSYQLAQKSAVELVTDPPLPRDPTLFEIVKDELKDLKPVKTEFTPKGIFEIKEYDDTQLLKLYQTDDRVKDKIMEMYVPFADDALNPKSPTQKQSIGLMNAVSDLKNSLGAISNEDAFGVLKLREIVAKEESWKGQSAQDKEYWKQYYKSWGEGEEVAKEMNGLFWQLTQGITGQGTVYQKDKGAMKNVAMPTMLIGKFIDPDPVTGGSMKDNYILDFQWEEDASGSPLFKYKTSETEATAKMNGGDPYRTTNDFKEIRNMYGYKLGDKASKFASGYDDFARKQGFWDETTKSYDYKKMKELFTPSQPLDLDRARMLKDQYGRIDTYAGDVVGLIYQGNLQMNKTQTEAYDAFKAQANREPTKNELKKLLEKYYE